MMTLKAHSQKIEKPRLVVIFRRCSTTYSDGEIIALFPELPADDKGRCTSYVHVGQHGAADYEYCVTRTRPATKKEYAPLLKELKNIYNDVDLVVKKRRPAKR